MVRRNTRYAVEVESSDDADIEAELVRFKDDPRTLEEVQVLCRRLGLNARLYDAETGALIDVAPDGSWRPAAGPWKQEASGHSAN